MRCCMNKTVSISPFELLTLPNNAEGAQKFRDLAGAAEEARGGRA